MEKEECAICYEEVSEKLECGHKIHLECAKKQFKPECPLCRKKLNIKVTGSLVPRNNYPPIFQSPIWDFVSPVQDEVIEHFEGNSGSVRSVGSTGSLRTYASVYELHTEFFPYLEESQEINEENYDEENPHGDNVEYEDC